MSGNNRDSVKQVGRLIVEYQDNYRDLTLFYYLFQKQLGKVPMITEMTLIPVR